MTLLQREQRQSRNVPCIRCNSVRGMQAHRHRCSPARSHSQHQPNEVSISCTPLSLFTQHTGAPFSVLGIIAIPGMMTGAILGGSSVQQAARLQMVIMFMISSCTALSSISTTILALSVAVDTEHRIRADKIDSRPHAVYRARNWLVERIVGGVKAVWHKVAGGFKKQNKYGERAENGESEGLLG